MGSSHSNDDAGDEERNAELTVIDASSRIDALHADVNELFKADDSASRIVGHVVSSSVHQVTAYVTLKEEQEGARRPLWLKLGFVVLSYGIVYLQCAVAAAINYGASKPICIDNGGCPLGWWCDTEPGRNVCLECDKAWNPRKGGADMCTGGSEMMLNMMWMKDDKARAWTNRIGGDAGMPTTKQRVYMCDACEMATAMSYDTDGLDPEFMDVSTVFKKRYQANRSYDWASLVMASIVVALAASGEIRDILLCNFFYLHVEKQGKLGWRLAMLYLGVLRQYVFLPILVQSVCSLVVTQGGDAINVCLNAVAVLFLADLDNAMFQYGLDDDLREEVEGEGKVPLNRHEKKTFTVLKTYYLAAIPAVVISTVTLAKYEGHAGKGFEGDSQHGFSFMEFSLAGSFCVFGIGSLVETFCVVSHSDWKKKVLPVVHVIVCGAFGMGTLMMITLTLPRSPACQWGLMDGALC